MMDETLIEAGSRYPATEDQPVIKRRLFSIHMGATRFPGNYTAPFNHLNLLITFIIILGTLSCISTRCVIGNEWAQTEIKFLPLTLSQLVCLTLCSHKAYWLRLNGFIWRSYFIMSRSLTQPVTEGCDRDTHTCVVLTPFLIPNGCEPTYLFWWFSTVRRSSLTMIRIMLCNKFLWHPFPIAVL